MTSAHTPGPWRLDDEQNDPGQVIGGGYHFIDAGAGRYRPEHIDVGFHISSFMSVADARLITAAPDLLQSLRDVRQELWVDYCLRVGTSQPSAAQTDTFASRPHIRIIDAAISKATGEA